VSQTNRSIVNVLRLTLRAQPRSIKSQHDIRFHAFQTFPSAVLIPAIALRVSTMSYYSCCTLDTSRTDC
jgi:hypothetical protein